MDDHGSAPPTPGDGGNAALMLLRSAATAGARPAIVEGGEVTSYEELSARTLAVASALRSTGVEPGDRVMVVLRRGAAAAAAYFGALAAGAVAVVAYEGSRPRQLEHIASHSRARAVVAAPPGPEGGRPLVDVATVPADDGFEPVGRIDRDVAQIIYTSGSTGLPKGVTLSHGNVWAGMRAVVTYLRVTREDRLAALLPFSFDYGLNQLVCAVATGAALVVERSPVPHRIVAALRRHEVTVLAAVPPLWLGLLGVDSFRAEPLAALRVMTNTGGRLPVQAVRELRAAQPHAELVLMYGLTEAFRSTYLPAAEVDERPASIGRAIPGAEILVLREDGTACERGEVGQLVHRGPTVAMGYWNDPEATDRVYRENPLRPRGAPAAERVVFSGDLVRSDASGALEFVGRADRMIKSLGFRVGPDEVVEVLFASGEVVEALVATEPDDVRGERIVAYVVLAHEGSVERLETFCAQEMPAHMRPARFEVRSELRRTSSGKHDPAATAAEPHTPR